MSGVSYRKCNKGKVLRELWTFVDGGAIASSSQEEGEQQVRVEQAKETRPNETVEKAKRFASGYFQFLNMLSKHQQRL